MRNHSHTLNSLRVILLCPIAFGVLYLFSRSPSAAEWYAVNIYPIISKAINGLSSLTPISIAEPTVVIFFGIILLYTVVTVFSLFFSKKRWQKLWNYILNIAATASIIFFLFVFFSGINYHRLTFGETSGLDIRDSSANELYMLCNDLAVQTNNIRNLLDENEDGVASSSLTVEAMSEKCRKAYDTLSKEYPTLTKGYSGTKPVYNSEIMSYSGITGVFFPFTFEANVNVAVPQYTLPATMCHELTHLRGYMREDEANFISYLVCKQSDDPFIQYSGYMIALTHALNRLHAEDTELYQKAMRRVGSGVEADLRYSNAYWAAHEGVVNEISSKVNDVYLKVNSQEDGVKSYGRMVDLLLAEMRSKSLDE